MAALVADELLLARMGSPVSGELVRAGEGHGAAIHGTVVRALT